MSTDALLGPDDCNCLAARQAARHITQFYDQFLALSGLRTTQFFDTRKTEAAGAMTINTLALPRISSWTGRRWVGTSCSWSVTA
jgi:hypothetical protein